MELHLDYHTRPRINNIPIEQKVNEVTTLQQSEKEQITCSSTNQIYQNIQKGPPKEKNWDNPLSFRKSKKYRISTTRP